MRIDGDAARVVRPDAVYASSANTRWFMCHVKDVEPTADVAAGPRTLVPLPERLHELGDVIVEEGHGTLEALLDETATDGVAVMSRGAIVYERCFRDFTPHTPHLCHSITKSVASCVAANLVDHGLLRPDEPVADYVPELAGSAYGDARVRDLLDMTVGIRYTEDHEDEESEDARLDRLCGLRPSRSPDEPGSVYDYACSTSKQGEHGKVLHYVSLNTDVLGWVMERASGKRVPELVATHVWSKLGGEDNGYIALDGAGNAQLDGGLCCSLRDLGRFGQMLVQSGRCNGRPVVPPAWIDDVCLNGDTAAFEAAPDCGDLPRGWSYRSGFWVGARSDHTPFLCLGMYGQMVYVNREAEVVVAKFSSQDHAVDDRTVARTFRAFEVLAGELARASI